jgi:putative solute:sodium symporter small subunit
VWAVAAARTEPRPVGSRLPGPLGRWVFAELSSTSQRVECVMESESTFDSELYWRRTIRRIVLLMGIWFLVGPMMGIVLVEPLNRLTIGGVPFGFWMAQQGAIYVFVVLIFLNSWFADRTDREFDVHETLETTQHVHSVDH